MNSHPMDMDLAALFHIDEEVAGEDKEPATKRAKHEGSEERVECELCGRKPQELLRQGIVPPQQKTCA